MSGATAMLQRALISVVNSHTPPAAWDEYVSAHGEATPFHMSAWPRSVERAYGYKTNYITAYRDDRIVGALALSDVRTPLLGRSFVSTAFSVGGGPLADDEESLLLLLETASVLAADAKVQYVECRSDFTADAKWFEKTGLYADFSLPVEAQEAVALSAIPRKRRAELRKGLKLKEEGRVTVRHDGKVDEFYNLYARSVHALGTPVFPKKFVEALVEKFGTMAEVLIIEVDGEPVAALLSFYFKNRVYPYYIGASDKARNARAFDLAYWEVMRRAAARDITTFEFGRSKVASGPFEYKKLWGAEPRMLTYRVRLISATEPPNVSPTNPKFSFFAKAWPRLPLAVANRVGPMLAPNFP